MHTTLFYHCSTPPSFSNLFTLIQNVHNYNTRLSSREINLLYSLYSKNNRKFGLKYKVPFTWNSVDDIIKESSKRNFLSKTSRHSFLKLSFEIRFSQTFRDVFNLLFLHHDDFKYSILYNLCVCVQICNDIFSFLIFFNRKNNSKVLYMELQARLVDCDYICSPRTHAIYPFNFYKSLTA